MAAVPLGSRRYTSPVYEDKYFPERNAAIPFKWEMSPGRPKYDSDNNDEEKEDEQDVAAEDDGDHDEQAGLCLRCNTASNLTTDHRDIISRDQVHLPDSPAHTPAAAYSLTIYPLPPPPNLAPASPLLVKDLLLHGGMHDLKPCNDHSDANHHSPPLQAAHLPLQHAFRRHFFSRLSFRFRPLKAASTVVPLQKNCCAATAKPHLNVVVAKAPTSMLAVNAAPYQRVRSQSFRHARNVHEAAVGAKQTASNVADPASLQASRRRCNSFNHSHSVCRAAVINVDGSHDVVDADPASITAAAMWTGACILAAAGLHDVVFSEQHDPGRVAVKLRDLMQQSRNFSEPVERPCTMKKLKKGGGSMISESLVELGLCQQATVAPAVNIKSTRSPEKQEEEVPTEAFLGESMKKSCTYDADEHGGKIITAKDKASPEEEEGDDGPRTNKGDKRSSFCKVLKNECIACWCPSPAPA